MKQIVKLGKATLLTLGISGRGIEWISGSPQPFWYNH